MIETDSKRRPRLKNFLTHRQQEIIPQLHRMIAIKNTRLIATNTTKIIHWVHVRPANATLFKPDSMEPVAPMAKFTPKPIKHKRAPRANANTGGLEELAGMNWGMNAEKNINALGFDMLVIPPYYARSFNNSQKNIINPQFYYIF